MDTRQAYNTWASQYDTNANKTRDLEGTALRASLAHLSFDRCLEIGCGTGKNTQWLTERARQITAVDLSEEMLAKAREKIPSGGVQFRQADITAGWAFRDGLYDLVSFSLVLEHIQDLGHIFREAASSLLPGGYVYVGELHPFKQYTGTKARFDTEEGRQVVECFIHHISDFTGAARQHGLTLIGIDEYFDEEEGQEPAGEQHSIPRILTLLWRKP
jgi:ubiquinone/menaquinone biosynthesis C-methylase UbiE